MNRYARSFFTMIVVIVTGFSAISPTTVGASTAAAPMPREIQSLDGKGNNRAHPTWGSANQPFLRLSKAAYADGVSSPSGADRPNARTLSNIFSTSPVDGVENNRDFSAFVYAWGQFIDHDLDLTGTESPTEAFPITVPAGDASFDPQSTGKMTIPLSRSAYASSNGIRQQVNSISAFIDGSQIYGVDSVRAAALRTFSGGRMKTSAGDLLPFNTGKLPNANDAHLVDDAKLFLAGDVRANENPELISMQTLFVREHNRLAAQIAQRNPAFTDEQIFQQARRTVIAELQKITYEEFLPAILGRPLRPYAGYNPGVNPGIATEFSTAAFRVGHSMVGDDIEFLNNNGKEIRGAVAFRDAFFDPTIVSQTGIDPILKYLATDDAQEIDTLVVDDLRNFLFGAPGQGGFDLAALNIQRGRDHGLADYNTVRAAYGLPRVTRFDQITANKILQAKLAAAYGNVNKIDLWVGGLAEDHLPGSSLGATFTRIIADQFTRLRDGDRFWYQNLPQPIPGMDHVSLANIIRLNTTVSKLQRNVFFYNKDTTVMLGAGAAATTQNPRPANAQPEGQRPPRRRLDPLAFLVPFSGKIRQIN